MSDKLEKLESKMIKELEPMFARTKKFSEPKSMFWVINGRSNVNNKIEELIKKSKESINIVTSENGLKRLVMFRDLLKSASKKGVKIKINAPLTAENKQDAKDLEFCNLGNINRAHNHLFSVDNSECLVIDPILDDESLVQGRDIGMWIMSNSFTKFMDDLVHNNINSAETSIKKTNGTMH
jgi:sugar-specific transcriptional regulator TrmB